ncbi:MAG: HU family DNA-binding protein [Desulfonauticus sp.]|nr:HU family DNA-binding protein [Desulfonauticus sp.]
MNKSDLINKLAEDKNLSQEEASFIVNSFFGLMKDALVEGRRVEIRGLGSFKIKEYPGYVGRNPKTGEKINVPPKKLPFFKAGKELKDIINS